MNMKEMRSMEDGFFKDEQGRVNWPTIFNCIESETAIANMAIFAESQGMITNVQSSNILTLVADRRRMKRNHKATLRMEKDGELFEHAISEIERQKEEIKRKSFDIYDTEGYFNED